MSDPKLAFEMAQIHLELDQILPVRQITEAHRHLGRYKAVLASVKEVGLVEPLVVYPQKKELGKYLLVDGHQRYFALKELGKTSADCLISTDDECFTYNARISRLAPIQEHRMITRAVDNGVPAEKIAAALNLPLRVVAASMNLLDGINDEAADLLKDKVISPKAIRLLKKVQPLRQIEIAELMVATNNFGISYAEALILSTPKDQLANPNEAKKREGMSAEDIARMEEEMETLERDMKGVEESYKENVMNLTLARGYIKKLLENAKIVRYLTANHSDLLSEFESITAAESL